MEAFRGACEENDLRPIYLHAQYLVNLAGPDERIYQSSMAAVADAMGKAAGMGAEYVVTHIGSHRGSGLEAGLRRLRDALGELLEEGPEEVSIALEGSAGGGAAVGSTFEEMARILEGLPAHSSRLGFCLDTAHLWGLGHDLSRPEGVAATFQDFERKVSWQNLFVIHINDNLRSRGSRGEKHAVPGEGLIGQGGFQALVNLPQLREMAFIVEETGGTPQARRKSVKFMRSLVAQ
jgi:deoxyribonuclease-4